MRIDCPIAISTGEAAQANALKPKVKRVPRVLVFMAYLREIYDFNLYQTLVFSYKDVTP